MKKIIFAAFVMAACFASCEAPIVGPTEETTEQQSTKTKRFTFTLKGDFSDQWRPITRGYLSADSKDLTDVWVLDYKDGELVQQLHQDDNTADDFGKPVMNLTYGSHHIYIVASRGQNPTLNTTAKTITWTKVLDTFWKDYAVDVVATSNGNRAVTLDRAVTKLKLSFTDAIAEGTASITVTPSTWYYGLNYQTGTPCESKTEQSMSFPISASEVGSTTFINMFGFSGTTEWLTDIAIASLTSANVTIGSATITDAPFVRNRATEYEGPLFGSEGEVTMSLNTTWADAATGTW